MQDDKREALKQLSVCVRDGAFFRIAALVLRARMPDATAHKRLTSHFHQHTRGPTEHSAGTNTNMHTASVTH